MTNAAVRYEVQPVTAGMWDELRTFFGPSGAYSHCWCVWWRVTAQEYAAGCADDGDGKGAANRDVL